MNEPDKLDRHGILLIGTWGACLVSILLGIGNLMLWNDGESRRDMATQQRLRTDQLEARTQAIEARVTGHDEMLMGQDEKIVRHEQNIIQLGSVAHRHIEKPTAKPGGE